MNSPAIWVITILLFILGLFGIVVPGLPGLGLLFAGVLFYAWATGFATITGSTVLVIGIVALVAGLAEWYGSGIATRIGGGKRKAFWGALVGSVVGLLVGSAPGLLVGAFLGAVAGALAEGKDISSAGKIGLLSIVGIIGAKLVQLVFAIAIIIAFFIAVAI